VRAKIFNDDISLFFYYFLVLCSHYNFLLSTAIFKQPQYYKYTVITNNNKLFQYQSIASFNPCCENCGLYLNNSFALAILAKECGMSPTLLGPSYQHLLLQDHILLNILQIIHQIMFLSPKAVLYTVLKCS
jgi:hypothetical protein